MQSVQQKSQPTFNEMLRMGIRADEVGYPMPWDDLIRQVTKGDLECTARLLANIDKPKAQDYLAHLAERELTYVADFLNSLQIPFFFVGWDHKQSTVVQRCGPDRRSALALLNHQLVTQQPTAGPSNDRLNRIWQAVVIVLDELGIRDDVSFSLVWESRRSQTPEFDYSGHDRQVAWSVFWQSLPFEDRCRVSREAPPHHLELEEQQIERALHQASKATPQTSMETRESP